MDLGNGVHLQQIRCPWKGLWVGLKMKGKARSVWKCEMGYERVAALCCSATCRLEWTEIRMVCWMGGVYL